MLSHNILLRNQRDVGTYPVVGQLQGDLDEGIRTGAALLNQTLAKVIEGDDVGVHIVSQGLSHFQRAVDDFLALKEQTESLQTEPMTAYFMSNILTAFLLKKALINKMLISGSYCTVTFKYPTPVSLHLWFRKWNNNTGVRSSSDQQREANSWISLPVYKTLQWSNAASMKKKPSHHTCPAQSLGGMQFISTTSFQNWKLQAVIGQLLWAEFKRLSLTLFCIIYPSILSLLIYTNECNTLTSPLFMMVVQHVLPNLFF